MVAAVGPIIARSLAIVWALAAGFVHTGYAAISNAELERCELMRAWQIFVRGGACAMDPALAAWRCESYMRTAGQYGDDQRTGKCLAHSELSLGYWFFLVKNFAPKRIMLATLPVGLAYRQPAPPSCSECRRRIYLCAVHMALNKYWTCFARKVAKQFHVYSL